MIAKGNELSPPRRRSPDLNVTPLIDILLVLLIIFMVLTPSKLRQLESKIPEKPSPNRTFGDPFACLVTLSVDAHGRVTEIQLNGRTITDDEIESQLRDRFGHHPPGRRTVFIKAPRHTIYGEVVRVIDQVKAAGASPLGLQIDDLPVS